MRLRRLLSRDDIDRDIRKIAFVGDYLPRKCGIATFTHDLRNAVAQTFPDMKCVVIAVNDIPEGYPYNNDVTFEIEEQDQVSYLRAADYINTSQVDVVCVQHEYGIYGGHCGAMLLPFLKALRVPIVTTLHTILQEPSKEQHRILSSILNISSRVITMAEKGRSLLQQVYSANPSKLALVPHGIPEMEFANTEQYKELTNLSGFKVVLTFGLLSPNKGVEFAIRAMAPVVREMPNVLYVILGQTHPALIREHGESYRNSLEFIAKDLGIERNVRFVNRFVDLPLLKQYIAACDVYLTPYLYEAQITSGTLSYSFGMGTAVVSTPYWHAAELLADGRGVLVPFRDTAAISNAVIDLLKDDAKRMTMKRNAFEFGRTMTWSNTAKAYKQVFQEAQQDRVTSQVMLKPHDEGHGLPDIKLDHMFRMTDMTGLVQHATFTVPNYQFGYSIDDVARALLFLAKLRGYGYQFSLPTENLLTTFAAFVNFAHRVEDKRFHNFLGYNRNWLDEVGSEDSHGRTLWAVGACVRYGVHEAWARTVFVESLPCVINFTSPRAFAFALLGIRDFLERYPDHGEICNYRLVIAEKLMKMLDDVADDDSDWKWFEEVLTYDNAILPHSLIITGHALNDPVMTSAGLDALEWLVVKQVAPDGILIPVGNGEWYKKGGHRSVYDQQPLEAGGLVLAAVEAYQVSGNDHWKEIAHLSFGWFMGRNIVGKPLYTASTGGVCDGLHRDGINENQGAESLVSFLLALVDLKVCSRENAPPASGFSPALTVFQ